MAAAGGDLIAFSAVNPYGFVGCLTKEMAIVANTYRGLGSYREMYFLPRDKIDITPSADGPHGERLKAVLRLDEDTYRGSMLSSLYERFAA